MVVRRFARLSRPLRPLSLVFPKEGKHTLPPCGRPRRPASLSSPAPVTLIGFPRLTRPVLQVKMSLKNSSQLCLGAARLFNSTVARSLATQAGATQGESASAVMISTPSCRGDLGQAA